MKKIYQICKKFLDLCKVNKVKSSIPTQIDTDTDTEYQLGVSIRFSAQDNIDLFCELPQNIDSLDKEQLVFLSEKYAELLLYMNHGLLTNQIFDILLTHSKDKDNTNLTLFIDNIMSFYDILNAEFLKLKNQKHTKPVIRPTSVFKHTT